MKGAKLFNLVTPPEVVTLFGDTAPIDDNRRGRNAAMLAQRNERLCARLFYYRKWYKHWSQEYVMERLVDEFDLTPVTIPQVLDELARDLRRLRDMNPDIEWFRERWPWMVWEDAQVKK